MNYGWAVHFLIHLKSNNLHPYKKKFSSNDAVFTNKVDMNWYSANLIIVGEF